MILLIFVCFHVFFRVTLNISELTRSHCTLAQKHESNRENARHPNSPVHSTSRSPIHHSVESKKQHCRRRLLSLSSNSEKKKKQRSRELTQQRDLFRASSTRTSTRAADALFCVRSRAARMRSLMGVLLGRTRTQTLVNKFHYHRVLSPECCFVLVVGAFLDSLSTFFPVIAAHHNKLR